MKFTICLFLLLLPIYGQAQMKFKKIFFFDKMTCFIDSNNKLKCWGAYVPLLDYVSPSVATPQMIDLGMDVKSAAFSFQYGCAVSLAGEVKCWGEMPGDAEKEKRELFKWELPQKAKSVAVNPQGACVLLENGDVWCLGRKDWSKKEYTGSSKVTPFLIGKGVSQLVANILGFRILINGDVMYWRMLESKLTKVSGLKSNVKLMASSLTGTCHLLDDENIQCEDGNSTVKQLTSIQGIDSQVIHLDVAQKDHGCATLSNGSVKCWGNGPLTLGKGTQSYMAITIDGLSNALETTTDYSAGCALLKDASISCWGGGFNLLGNGDGENLPVYKFNLP